MTFIITISLVIIGLVVGLFFLIILGTLRRKGRWGINLDIPECPNCGTSIKSQVRVPKSTRQALWGGWTCPKCYIEIDKWGNQIS